MLEADQTSQKTVDEPSQEMLKNSSPNEFSKQIYDQISDLAAKLTETHGRIKEQQASKKQTTNISIFFAMAGLATFIYKSTFNNEFNVLWIFIAFTGAIFMIIASFGTQGKILTLQTDVDIYKEKLRIASIFLGNVQESSNSYFDSLVRINVDNLASYYALVKIHTDKSFLVSITAGVIGFILIGAGLVVGFYAPLSTHIIAYITSAAGILTELISGVFFYLYNRTVQQMKGYHDSLLVVQNILLSFKLVEDTKDEVEKAKMVMQMLEYLVSKQEVGILSETPLNK